MTETIYQRDELALLKDSGAETSSTNGAAKTLGPTDLVQIVVHVTAVSGTNPTLDLAFQQSSDNFSADTEDVVKAPQITAVGVYKVYAKFTKLYLRYSSTIGGTDTPTFTYEVGLCKP